MAGRGPAPKPAGSRARRNKDAASVVLRFVRGEQPDLPELSEDHEWHPMTRRWWDTWGRAAQAEGFTDTDWAFLLDTALMHHSMWTLGRFELAGEVRLRVQKFGATPEDRARLRMVFADADDKDERRARRASEPARPAQYKGLRLAGAVEA